MLPFQNRRKSFRIKTDINVFYAVSPSINKKRNLDTWISCEAYDISQEGLSLKVKQCLIPEETVKIKITVSKVAFSVDAVIKNVNGQRVGMKFQNLTEPLSEKIKGIISELVYVKEKTIPFLENYKTLQRREKTTPKNYLKKQAELRKLLLRH